MGKARKISKRAHMYFSLVLLILCASVTYRVQRSTLQSRSTPLNARVVWSLETDSPIITTPFIANENIIIRTNDEIISLNKSSGDINWEVRSRAYDKLIDDYGIPRQLTGNAQYLIAGEASNAIGIYSMTTGEVLWKIADDINFIESIQIINNIMVVARHDDDLAAYDLDLKQQLWRIKVPARTNLSITANKSNLVIAADRFLQVYDLKSGELLETTSYSNVVTGELILDDSTLFLIYNAENIEGLTVESLQLDSLSRFWNSDVGSIGHPYLYVTEHQLYLYDQALVALDKNTGALLWQEDSQDFYSRPVAYDNHLYFISTDGSDKKLCKIEIPTGGLGSCVTLGKVGLFGSGDDLAAPLLVDNMLIISHIANITAYEPGDLFP